MIAFVAWCILFGLCWPLALALLALVLWPLVWLVPFRLVGITFGAFFALLRTVLFLPAQIPGYRRGATRHPIQTNRRGIAINVQCSRSSQ